MTKQRIEQGWTRGRVLGRGTNGTVNLAVQKSNGGVFAVKSVDRSSCLPYQIEALEDEIRILKDLCSPYVVEYLGDGVTATMRNLYMEYLPGGPVADMARNRPHGGGADVDETILSSLCFCIVSALSYLHSKGIVHCDIKGDNVLVGPSPATAKLADFGSAVELKNSSDFRETEMENDEKDNQRILPRGSPFWMAPEVIRAEYQGPESDVWSLGCTVIEMVTGNPAWEDEGEMETLCRIGYSEFLPEFPSQLSELGRDFLEKCLRREPDQRWTCDQLLKHPFISTASSPKLQIHSSPRSIMDFFNMDSDEEGEEEEGELETADFPAETNDSGAKLRIKGLICGPGPIWESDGWVTVRGSEETSIAGAGEDEIARSECLKLVGEDGNIRRASAEFADSNCGAWLDSSGGNSEKDENENESANDDVVVYCPNPNRSRDDFGLENWSYDKTSRLLLGLLLDIWLQGYPTCIKLLILLNYTRYLCYITFHQSYSTALTGKFTSKHPCPGKFEEYSLIFV